jgi:hypothetical protein
MREWIRSDREVYQVRTRPRADTNRGREIAGMLFSAYLFTIVACSMITG